MAKKAFDKIMAGLDDAIAHSGGDKSRGISHTVPAIDVQSVRKKLGLSQNKFAQNFGIAVATLRNWEQGHRSPDGASRLLLAVIDRYPVMVQNVLQDLHPI